jgi:penicillin amidase
MQRRCPARRTFLAIPPSQFAPEKEHRTMRTWRVALVVLLSLTGCGGSDDDGGNTATTTPTSAAATASATFTPTSAATPTPTAEPTPTATATPSATVASPTPSRTDTPTGTATATEGPSDEELLLSIPATESWSLAGLAAEGHVVRTEANVPHVYARSRRDLAFLHGFVLARDRYVMIELSRRLALGELSSLLGDAALAFDVEGRGMGMALVAARIADFASAEQLEIFDAFAAGVNGYIREVQAGNLPLPSELEVAGPLLGAENPADLMVPIDRRGVAAMIATVVFQTSFDAGDLERAAAAAEIDGLFEGAPFAALRRQGLAGDVLDAVEPTVPVSSTIGFGLESGADFQPGPLPGGGVARRSFLAASDAAALGGLAARLRRFETLLGHDRERQRGSNVWAVAGSAAAGGAALLAGDGHLSLAVPSIMYQIALDTSVLGGGDTHQLGLTIPGLPIMIVGTNGRVAWSQTQLHGDVTDFYREEIALDAAGFPATHRFGAAARPLIRVEESYVIADVPALGSVGRTEVVPRWTTLDGRPLIDVEGREVTEEAPAGEGEAVVLIGGRSVVPGDVDLDGKIDGVSFDYAGFDVQRMLDGPDGFGHARDVFEFREHSRQLVAFSQNIIAADADGNIFYTAYHAVPCRGYLERDDDGEFAPGADPLFLLDGTRFLGFEIPFADGVVDEDAAGGDPQRCIVPFDSTPQAINPERAYLFNANNDPANIARDGSLTDDAWYLGGPWDTGWRGGRIDALLAGAVAEGGADVARMAAIQADHRSPLGAAFSAFLFEAIETARALSLAAPPLSEDEARLVALYEASRAAIDEAEGRLRAWAERGFAAASGLETFYSSPSAEDRHDAVATMIFNAWMARVVRGVWDDEGLPAGLFWRRSQTQVLLIKRFLEARGAEGGGALASLNPDTGESIFFDVATTPEVERSREVLLGALADALAFLSSAPAGPGSGGFGTGDQNAWLWGLRHQVRFESLLKAFLGDDPLFGIFASLFAIDTDTLPLAPDLPEGDPRAELTWFPRPGDNWGVDAANPGFSGQDFTYADGPIMRMVIALDGGEVRGQNIIPGGQSGLTDSPHFADQAALWLGNQTIPLRFRVAEVAAGAMGREVYRPATP